MEKGGRFNIVVIIQTGFKSRVVLHQQVGSTKSTGYLADMYLNYVFMTCSQPGCSLTHSYIFV